MTRLSSLQFPVLKEFVDGKPYMSYEECQHLDQRPFRSMLIRGYVAYRPGKGFHITPVGTKAWDDFRFHEYHRKNPTLPLTAYFDPTAYGLRDPRKVREIRRSA